ncbi:hypothetical protein K431DRAFT_288705 [Polychaeton citri CBS 116435]|uniref:Letm1 RBD domain-containing protein n=1 Tax=Polychaeton citri CBS 116435 TaxID=1314669 RepID=A0A9P4ULF2_9PEZI|nr:hypothetical protein K431DRAFT_288705 [Polychaeton citri CBS 116435]
MITKSPGDCLLRIARTSNHHNVLAVYIHGASVHDGAAQRGHQRAFATKRVIKPSPQDKIRDKQEFEKAKSQPILAIESVNPPRSTLPAPLDLPTRGREGTFTYLFRIGRAYGTFYKEGVKAVWANGKAGKVLARKIQERHGESGYRDFAALKYGFFSARRASILKHAVVKGTISRGEYQMLERQAYDVSKLPLFGLLVALLGEWLPLVVPFIPNAVPVTCRIPKQIQGMREKAEERRRHSFRQAVSEPSDEQLSLKQIESEASGDTMPLMDLQYAQSVLARLRPNQLHHVSCVLNTHGRLWDRLQILPPAPIIRSRIARRLNYFTRDDYLLLQHDGVKKLSPPEVEIACEQRGLDILGRKTEVLRATLTVWLERQKRDKGRGDAVMGMLFRRPNAWKI